MEWPVYEQSYLLVKKGGHPIGILPIFNRYDKKTLMTSMIAIASAAMTATAATFPAFAMTATAVATTPFTTLAMTTTTAVAAATAALCFGTGFCHGDCATIELGTMQLFDCLACLFLGGHFNKAKASAFAAELVHDNVH